MVRLLSIGGACLALAFAAGCGDDEEDPSASGGEATPTAEAPAPETSAGTEAEDGGGEEIVVTMKDFAFEPQAVEATVGQTITWRNEDDAPHNAVEEGGDLRTETFEKDGTDSYTVDEPGTIEYICTVHPQMTGTITVTE